MRLVTITFAFTLSVMLSAGFASAKAAGNGPYAAAIDGYSPFYARCIPEATTGSKGVTQIKRVRKEGDELIATFDWYNRSGIIMRWSPIAGKVAVMRPRQEQGLPPEKQIEFSFYIGDRFLRSYTTTDLVKLGAAMELDLTPSKRSLGVSSRCAAYRVEGCTQVWNTNDYYFSVRLDESRTLAFDILTGGLCRIENDGSKERMVPMGNAAAEAPGSAADQAMSNAAAAAKRYYTDAEAQAFQKKLAEVKCPTTITSACAQLGIELSRLGVDAAKPVQNQLGGPGSAVTMYHVSQLSDSFSIAFLHNIHDNTPDEYRIYSVDIWNFKERTSDGKNHPDSHTLRKSR
ncbi:MAG: hypothetical protein NTX50_11690 [Candidatus Sumerlaeota bacterium]|nr:hypothetical protein [Candidatus Sumerlaeota bacterium]